MSKHGTIRRYGLIIEMTSRNLYPTFRRIQESLFDQGFEISDRTIQRDIEQIRYEFGIEIAYDNQRGGYYIDREKSLDIEKFLRFLEIVNTAELLTESLKESKHALEYIDFESQGEMRGSEHLKPILSAIRNRRIITFSHEKYQSSEIRKHALKPYFLKEYRNRWYVAGLKQPNDDFRIYGIDRIHDLQVSERVFEHDAGTDPLDLVRNTIGINYNTDKPQRIVLSFTRLQGKYVKALPLHHSQETLVDNGEEFRISLFVTPNYELTQRILFFGPAVKVLEPDWLAAEIQEKLQANLQQYR